MQIFYTRTKKCKKCTEEKSVSHFERQTSWHCNECKQKMKKSYAPPVSKNPHPQYIKKSKTPCVVCGWFGHLSAIDYHHVHPANKSFELSRALLSYSIEKVDAEIAKCVCLCANCHRGVHSGDICLENYVNVEDFHIK
tara:strand:+ start:221 stop:634 length:414 start_codon:yes stop_codon:yes gene_type:complete